MGVSHSLAELKVKIHKAGELDHTRDDAFDTLSDFVEDRILPRVLKPIIGSDLTMSNWYGGGVALSVDTMAVGDTLRIKGSPVQAWAVLERGTGPHVITPKNRQALKFADGTFAANAVHPGMRPMRAWTKFRSQVEKEATRIFGDEVDSSLQEAFA